MAPHFDSVGLPCASLEPSSPKGFEPIRQNGVTFEAAHNPRINGVDAHSTNGVEPDHDIGLGNDRVTKPTSNQPVAVIGMGLRFPQDATSPDKFWQMLMDGRSARTEVPKERYNVESHYRSDGSLPDTVITSRNTSLNMWLTTIIYS